VVRTGREGRKGGGRRKGRGRRKEKWRGRTGEKENCDERREERVE
jgi:hypothetical protein